MGSPKKTGTVDPDYESYNSALELNEEEEKKTKLKTINKIIGEEYDMEINNKFENVKHAELQICKIRKLLDLTRNVTIRDYYNKKDLEYNDVDEEPSTSDGVLPTDKQNRIHPAIKKLLGKNSQPLDLIYLNNKRKRSQNVSPVTSKLSESTVNKFVKPKKIKTEPSEPLSSPETLITSDRSQGNKTETVRNRNKIRRRIVIGNISTRMPSSEDNKLTHKWTVYVRGAKEEEDVSQFVEKVIFHLHSSYKPHDVVEVGRHPFRLSRRGWGEFKIKVEIFFKVTLNKPVAIEHDIKLDNVFVGRPTLGNETIVDLFLYEESEPQCDSSVESDTQSAWSINDSLSMHSGELEEFSAKIENNLREELNNASTSFEHDYCFEEEKNDDFSHIPIFHSYSLSPFSKSKPVIEDNVIEDTFEDNKLIYGLDKSYFEPPKDLQVNNLQPEKILIPLNELNDFLQVHRKDIKFNNPKIIVLGKKIDGLLTNFSRLEQVPKLIQTGGNFAVKSDQKNFKVSLPKNKFKNMGEALPYLFRSLPLISELANNFNYKRRYPFTSPSVKEYFTWNVAKRRSAEWSRANSIKKIVVAEQIHEAENWSTKTILMYGRSHFYNPSPTFGLFARDSPEKELLLSCFTSSNPNIPSFNLQDVFNDDTDVHINVVSDTDVKETPKKYNKSTVDISDPELRHQCSYIRENALDCGVILRPEELIEGVMMNGAERMIFEAVKCLADNLVRRASNYKICRTATNCNKSFSNNETVISVQLEDVMAAIKERPEMKAIEQFKSKRKDLDY